MNLNRSHKILIVLTILLCLVVLFSCKTAKPIVLTKTVKDSSATEITVTPFDTLVWLAKHKAVDQEFSNCDSLYAILSRHHDSLISKSSGVKSTIIKQGKRLVFKCETDSLKEVIRLLRKEKKISNFKTVTVEVPVKCKEEHKTWWDGLYKRGFWIMLLVIAGSIAWRFRKVLFGFIP